VLSVVAERLRSQRRASDIGGRSGGEEFRVILTHSDLQGVQGGLVFAERWRNQVAVHEL
jgi:GGDEF domain-containing protein